jgi:hypothetical protein
MPLPTLHGTVSLQDTHGSWVEVGTAARTVVRGHSVRRLHVLARIWAQTEPYRLEVRTEERPDGPPLDTLYGPALPGGWVPPDRGAAPQACPRESPWPIPVFIGD